MVTEMEQSELAEQSASISVGVLFYEKLKLVASSDELPFTDLLPEC